MSMEQDLTDSIEVRRLEIPMLSEKQGAGKPGSGQRFKKLTATLKKNGARSPQALAAWIGRKKYGKEKFQQMAAKGRKESVDEMISLVVEGEDPSSIVDEICS